MRGVHQHIGPWPALSISSSSSSMFSLKRGFWGGMAEKQKAKILSETPLRWAATDMAKPSITCQFPTQQRLPHVLSSGNARGPHSWD